MDADGHFKGEDVVVMFLAMAQRNELTFVWCIKVMDVAFTVPELFDDGQI